MNMYMVARSDYKVRVPNLMGMMCTQGNQSYIDHFRCWHRKARALQYIDELCKATGQSPKLYRVITLRTRPDET